MSVMDLASRATKRSKFYSKFKVGWALGRQSKYNCSNKNQCLGGESMDWKKGIVFGSFAAGALLFLTGRRPAGLVIAGVGLAALAVEHPERFEDLWNRLPEYIDKGSKLVDGAATFMEKLSQQQGGGYRNIPVAGGNRY